MSGGLEPPQWPPRSPYEAKLHSPNSKSRAQQRYTRSSTSPSPLKRSAAVFNLKSNPKAPLNIGGGMDEDEEEDEDEETLQLRLQTLEAKLKLKKLQSKKAKVAQNGSALENEEGNNQSTSRVASVLSSSRAHKQNSHESIQSNSSTEIQVPISPERREPIVHEQRSPGRVLLGIDKGLSGRNVSLRRAPNSRLAPHTDSDPLHGRFESRASKIARVGEPRPIHAIGMGAGKSFNERIAENRDRGKQEEARRERLERLRKERSTGFGIPQGEIDAFRKASAEKAPDSQSANDQKEQRSFSRDEVIKAMERAHSQSSQRVDIAPNGQNTHHRAQISSTLSRNRGRPDTSSSGHGSRLQTKPLPPSSNSVPIEQDGPEASHEAEGDSSLYEPFSSTNLSRRILPHTFLQRTLEDKTPTTIPTLLREIKGPDFSLPESLVDADFVLFGIVASKSAPISHKENHRTAKHSKDQITSQQEAAESTANQRGKFIVLNLTNLKWTLDLYLFATAYTRFRKLTPGTLVAILNPSIMPPPRHKLDTGRWSLTISSSEDTILEIGTAKDLAWCKAIKKDGTPCGDWIDRRKTEFCDYHVNRKVEDTRRGRMEVQGMSTPFGPGGKRGGHYGHFGSSRQKGGAGGGRFGEQYDGTTQGDGGLRREGRQYDRAVQSTYFLAPGVGGISAASLLDMEEAGGRGEKQERQRRALAERERENEIARKLGAMGSGAGQAYLRARHPDIGSGKAGEASVQGSGNAQHGGDGAKDALSLGLKGNKAGEVLLSPLKRKRPEGNNGTAKKKTRFVTANGIREAGRESLGTPGVVTGPGDDDDLVIL